MKSFLQSQEWLDFQRAIGRKAWQINDINVIKYNLPFKKSYLYVPRCGGNFLSERFLNKIKEIAKQENAIFLRVEPQDNIDLKNLGFKKSHDIQPNRTLILDITKPEQELLEQMHQKTRYNIRLAQRKKLKVKSQKLKIENFEDFWRLIEGIKRRDGFRPHPKEYYRKMLEIPGVELFLAIYKDKIIAANIIMFYNKIAIYLHGASDYEHRNLMAPFLLQWNQILEAKKRGCIEYDFWGIDDKKWPGVTRFKKGFCPRASCGGSDPSSKSFRSREVSYPGAYDLVFQPIWYRIYKIARKIL